MGGLGDVAASLPKALKKLGVDIRVVLPLYRGIKQRKEVELIKKDIVVEYNEGEIKINILRAYLPNSRVPIYFIENKKWFSVKDIFDANNRERFVLFSYLAAQLPEIIKWKADIIHANDWHTGMANIFSKGKLKSLYTIHNLAYKGSTPVDIFEKFGLGAENFSVLDKKGRVNIMKEAILQSSLVNTVSPTYAKEILTYEAGRGLHGVLKERKDKLSGILNGIDTEIWNPYKDRDIYQIYKKEEISFEKKGTLMEDMERNTILKTLVKVGGNRTHAAKDLGISRRNLIYKLQKYKEEGYTF